jgi:hypothetical protein
MMLMLVDDADIDGLMLMLMPRVWFGLCDGPSLPSSKIRYPNITGLSSLQFLFNKNTSQVK